MAGQIPTQFIDDLLTRVDITDIIDSRVSLKKAGKNLSACCPFHNEKTASFTVSPEKQFYHCFGCGANGNAIGFLMEYEQLSFPESIQELADTVGMTVPTQSFPAIAGKQDLYALLDKVCQYYIHQLQAHPQREMFVTYLQQRGLSPTVIEQFNIGMAPDGWDNVLRTFGTSEEARKQLNEVGILSTNDNGKTYDRFRKRIMFPIRDRRGRIVGFGGRVLDDSSPKYLNSPETPIFQKSNELYGLYEARKSDRKLETILIVEGYMDVVALADHDIRNSVATMGTATTVDHLRQLLRTASEVVFCFDGDRAGRDAAWRAAENSLALLDGKHQLKFMFLPDGEDPDSLVRREGQADFNLRIEKAQNFSDFFLQTLEGRVDCSSMDGRARLVEEAKPYLRHIPVGIYRDMLEQKLAEKAKTTMSQLQKHLDPPANNSPKRSGTTGSSREGGISPVRKAITILLQRPDLFQNIVDPRVLATLDLPGISILAMLLETLRENPHLNTAALIERWRDDKNSEHLKRLTQQPLTFAGDGLGKELTAILQSLQKKATEQRQKYLTSKPLAELTAAEKQEIQLL